jgi:hypothetical protein
MAKRSGPSEELRSDLGQNRTIIGARKERSPAGGGPHARVDLASERAVRNALRPILGGALDDVWVFNPAINCSSSPIPRLFGLA